MFRKIGVITVGEKKGTHLWLMWCDSLTETIDKRHLHWSREDTLITVYENYPLDSGKLKTISAELDKRIGQDLLTAVAEVREMVGMRETEFGLYYLAWRENA